MVILVLLMGFTVSYFHLTSAMSERAVLTARNRRAAVGTSVLLTVAFVLLLRFGPPFVQFTFGGSGDDVQRVSHSELHN